MKAALLAVLAIGCTGGGSGGGGDHNGIDLSQPHDVGDIAFHFYGFDFAEQFTIQTDGTVEGDGNHGGTETVAGTIDAAALAHIGTDLVTVAYDMPSPDANFDCQTGCPSDFAVFELTYTVDGATFHAKGNSAGWIASIEQAVGDLDAVYQQLVGP